MEKCTGETCWNNNLELVTNIEVTQISGPYKTFLEIASFGIFLIGACLNTGILTSLLSVFHVLESFDVLIMNLVFSQIIAAFGIAFIFFIEFTTTMAPIGDGGCSFVAWLTIMSATVHVYIIVTIVIELHRKIVKNNHQPYKKHQVFGMILWPWVLAAIPTIPYIAASYMNDEAGMCKIRLWRKSSQIVYYFIAIFVEIIVPLFIILISLIQIFSCLRNARSGDTMLIDETNPGSEESFQRGMLKRKAKLVTVITAVTFIILITISLIELMLMVGLETSSSRYNKIRELASLIQCFTCISIPIILLAMYDTLKRRLKNMLPCWKNQDVYNSLRFNVYQQTVQETTVNSQQPAQSNKEDEEEEEYRVERDDVAILN